MADKKGLQWLSEAKAEIAATDEWKRLTLELNEAVQQHLTENHVSYFADLTNVEKLVFLNRASKLVKDGSRYTDVVAMVGRTVDRCVNEAILGELMSPHNDRTKTQLLMDSTCDACVNILQKWPSLKPKLFSNLNRPLPPKLRKIIWKMFLDKPSINDDYILKKKSKSTQALQHESVIKQRSEAFLLSEQKFQALSMETKTYLVDVMTSSLVYYSQISSNQSHTLGDTEYMLAIPFIEVFLSDMNIKKDQNGKELLQATAQFVEVFTNFMETRPLYLKDSGSMEFHSALKQVGITMATLLEQCDLQLATFLQKALAEDGSQTLQGCLSVLVRAYIRSMFVGYVSMDVLCYIWDQYVISIKYPKFQSIPTFAVALLLVLKTHLLACKNRRQLEDALFQGAKEVKTQELQNIVHDHFLSGWRQLIEEEVGGSELPLVDPIATLGGCEPWAWWLHDAPVPRQYPGDRRAAREKREADRLQRAQEKKRAELRKAHKEEEKLRAKEDALRRTFHQEKTTQEQKIAELENALHSERRARYDVEQDMAEEIRRLREQLTDLTGVAASPSVARSTSLPPTPRSVQSEPPPSRGEGEVQGLLRQLVCRSIAGVEQLAIGIDIQKEEVQRKVAISNRRNLMEYKEAELAVFGGELSSEDWDQMTSEERENNRKRLLDKLKEMRAERARPVDETQE
ncbi:uncharacterized protein LOC5510899 [Nematostella vectensis]|uniref:uncharacterized protein LOC5510899 n=1 Tax=Nematostella vectensis TaxID=45351 RepID=UPI002077077C|nr:uncharacterized protein LOC5510899 [Nematostella vectensis]